MGGYRVRDRLQRFVDHLDQLGRVASPNFACRDDHGDLLADPQYFFSDQRVDARVEDRRAVAVEEFHVFGIALRRKRAHAVRFVVGAAKNREYTGCGLRFCHIDLPQTGMCVAGSDEDGVGLARFMTVVTVTAFAAQQAGVLGSGHRFPDTFFPIAAREATKRQLRTSVHAVIPDVTGQ